MDELEAVAGGVETIDWQKHPCEYEKVSEEVRPIYNNGKHATVTTYKCIYCGRKKELYVV